MKIASWNVNSIKARLDHVKRYLERVAPDVLMIQELKGLEFPADEFKALGYKSEATTQKAYNGVAILSKSPFEIIKNHLPGDKKDEQARYLEAEIKGQRLINIYLPNGNPVPGEKYDYKLAWMKRLKKHLEKLRNDSVPFAIGGDFNTIPEPKDCFDPEAWKDDALFKLETRQHFRELINLGLTDAFRVNDSRAEQYTYWSYKAASWEKGHGIRIDHFLLSPEIADKLKACTIDIGPRGEDKPSDHTPIMVEIAA